MSRVIDYVVVAAGSYYLIFIATSNQNALVTEVRAGYGSVFKSGESFQYVAISIDRRNPQNYYFFIDHSLNIDNALFSATYFKKSILEIRGYFRIVIPCLNLF